MKLDLDGKVVLSDTLSRWTFYTPAGEMLEAQVVVKTLSNGRQLFLELIDAANKRVKVPLYSTADPMIEAVNRALAAMQEQRAPAPSRLARGPTKGRSRLGGGGS